MRQPSARPAETALRTASMLSTGSVPCACAACQRLQLRACVSGSSWVRTGWARHTGQTLELGSLLCAFWQEQKALVWVLSWM